MKKYLTAVADVKMKRCKDEWCHIDYTNLQHSAQVFFSEKNHIEY